MYPRFLQQILCANLLTTRRKNETYPLFSFCSSVKKIGRNRAGNFYNVTVDPKCRPAAWPNGYGV